MPGCRTRGRPIVSTLTLPGLVVSCRYRKVGRALLHKTSSIYPATRPVSVATRVLPARSTEPLAELDQTSLTCQELFNGKSCRVHRNRQYLTTVTRRTMLLK